MTLTQPPITQGAVLRLDAARFRRELYIRGITAGTVARVAGVAPNTVSRILAGAPISIGTLRAIAKALDSLPVLHGVDELLAVETTRNAAVPTTAAFEEDGADDTGPQTEQ
jgi:transcriptional regulator with XRE-family HTH domain